MEIIFQILSRTEHSEEDKQRNCVHYPTLEYQTYAECDQDYVRRTLPSDLVPFWNVDNISQASSFYERNGNEEIWQRALTDIGIFRIKMEFLALIGAQEMLIFVRSSHVCLEQ